MKVVRREGAWGPKNPEGLQPGRHWRQCLGGGVSTQSQLPLGIPAGRLEQLSFTLNRVQKLLEILKLKMASFNLCF